MNAEVEAVAKRFSKVLDDIVQSGKEKSVNAVATTLGTYWHRVIFMSEGKAELGVKYIEKLKQNYHVNPNYLFSVSENMYLCEATK